MVSLLFQFPMLSVMPSEEGMWVTKQTFSEGLDGKWGLEISGAEREAVLLGCSCL